MTFYHKFLSRKVLILILKSPEKMHMKMCGNPSKSFPPRWDQEKPNYRLSNCCFSSLELVIFYCRLNNWAFPFATLKEQFLNVRRWYGNLSILWSHASKLDILFLLLQYVNPFLL